MHLHLAKIIVLLLFGNDTDEKLDCLRDAEI